MNLSNKYVPLLFGFAMVVGIFFGALLNFDTSEKIFASNSKKDKLNRLIDYIDYEYVDKVNTDSIVDITVNGILENLDPHSVYIPANLYQESADDMRGNFVGIGIRFYVYKDTIAVIKTIPDGPAEQAGILAGDRLLYADDQQIFGSSIDKDSITSRLKGERNTKVSLTIYRKGLKELLDFDILRKEVALATKELGIKAQDCLVLDFEVRKFPENRQDILQKMIDLNNEYQPDIVFLPSPNDTHQDHNVISTEGFRAFKRVTMLGYEVPWNNLDFRTSCFFELSEENLSKKCNALE